MIFFSEKDIQAQFEPQTFVRGWHYQKTGKVQDVSVYSVSENEWLIQAKVQGSRKHPYEVSIEIDSEDDYTGISGECPCPVGFDCKHIAAVLLEVAKNPHHFKSKPKPSTHETIIETNWLKNISKKNTLVNTTTFEGWIRSLDKSQATHAVSKSENIGNNRLIYVLKIEAQAKPAVIIHLFIAKSLKRGGFGTQKTFSDNSDAHYNALLSIDHDILHKLEVVDRSQGEVYGNIYKSEYELSTVQSANILEDILKTGRCYWQTEEEQILLTLGEIKKGHLVWEMETSGEQRLICEINKEEVVVLPFMPAWYIQKSQGTCGPLETGLGSHLSGALLFAPPLLPIEVGKAQAFIKKQSKETQNLIPLPQNFKTIEGEVTKPRPKLFLFGLRLSHYFFSKNYFDMDDCVPFGRLTFMYDKMEIQLDAPEQVHLLDRENKLLKKITRQFSLERDHINLLLKKGGSIFSKQRSHLLKIEPKPQDFLIGDIGREDLQEAFLYETIPELRILGWEVVVDSSFPVEYVLPIDEWYSEIHETSEYDWFNMELGFVLDGQKINILPLLVGLIERNPAEFTEQYFNKNINKNYSFTLPNGQKVQVPSERIKGILATLSELYDAKSLNQVDQLLISRLRARQLLELEKAMQTTKLRWLGAERLQKLNQKLIDFKSVKPVKIPKKFKGELRDYQKQGINWLGFLREYQLGGILSDDMGLGKTVQALVHILVEKQEKRLSKPCLVVAPTSLMSNWKNEAKQFTPSLKVLMLQGQFRKQLFDEVQGADIVLTTYSLIVRDKEALLKNEYEMIILDEAQYIKNAHTNAYQVLQQLRAAHRLCLTGTPMENHLGELWSLFNFLSPGLLGNSKQFTQIFRTPIEKQGNITRQQSLNQRIYPYILRRTKDQVVKELPPKTEIICNIELPDAQRDLYESIRLSVEKKLNKVIHERGLASSQILILDALLKLRQVCCDPRLLSLEQAKKVKTSEKLNFLMKMLKQLVEEGRRILLFSSFTSMLSLIEAELKEQSIQYVKLTGSTKDRETPIQQFQGGGIPVFLISLKAGGTGLNLTAADTVIHYDPWWNPAAEAQATDRAHRIGQTKSLFVYKLVTVGTVEEKILSMQQKKRALLEGLFEGQQKAAKVGITKEDLNFLFKPIELIDEPMSLASV